MQKTPRWRLLGCGAGGVLASALLSGTAFAQQGPGPATPVSQVAPQPVIHTVGQLYDLIESQRLQLEAQ